MKLHLPSTLRTALIATMTCLVGSAYATDYTAVVEGTSGNQELKAQTGTDSAVALSDVAADDKIIFDIPSNSAYKAYMPISSATTTLNADLQIDNLYLKEGGKGKAYIFNGAISGSGTWYQGNILNLTYTFNGDVSGFTGTFDFDQTSGHTFAFNNTTAGTTRVLNATVNVNGSVTFNAAATCTYDINSAITANAVTLSGAGTHHINSLVTANTLTIAADATLSTTEAELNLSHITNLANNGTIDLRTPAATEDEDTATAPKLRLTDVGMGGSAPAASGLYELGDSFSVGSLLLDDEADINDILSDLGSRQTATYNSDTGVISITESTKATLTWKGTGSADFWTSKTAWQNQDSKTDTLQYGDDVILSAAASAKTIYTDVDMKLGTVTAEADYQIDVNTGKTISATIMSEGHTIRKTASGSLQVNEGSSMGTLQVERGSALLKSGSSVATLNASDGTTQIEAGSSVSEATVGGGGLVLLNGIHSSVDGITLTSGNVKTAATDARQATVNGTVTIKNTAGTATKLTIKSKGNDGVAYTNFYVDNSRISAINSSYTYNGSTHTGAKVSGATVNVLNDYVFQRTDFSESSVNVAAGVTLSNNVGDGTVTFGALSIQENGKITNSGTIKYTGDINLTLGTTTFTAAEAATLALDYAEGYSSNALSGAMNAGSTLTLDFGSNTITPDNIVFTLTGLDSTALAAASGYNITTNTYTADGVATDIFTVNGWTVDSITTGTNTVLNLSRNIASIPEPATSTLSLLALAGLAARRRRK